jgi:hypothetical protein
VRLHQPSAFYGVNSRALGTESIDEFGPNAGFYDRATAAEICNYFDKVLDGHLVRSGRVRFFGMCDVVADVPAGHRFVSRLTRETTTVQVRRKVVDATYLETPVPSTHTPAFDVDPGARFIPVNGLVTLEEAARGYTVIGAGKTAMDACTWLLENGVAPDAIRWIRPRDAWMLDRAYNQPLDRLAELIEGAARSMEAAAEAESIEDLFRRLEAAGQLLRIDVDVEPTMFRCAVLSQAELARLREVEHVVRKGHVRHIGAREITLDDGTIPTDSGQVHIDCTAAGLRASPARPIFEPGRITIQQVRTCQPTFNAAFIAFVEAARGNDADRNHLCPPNPYPNAATDWISGQIIAQRAQAAWSAAPDVTEWLDRSRLNAARGIAQHMSEPAMRAAMKRMMASTEPAVANLERLDATPARADYLLRPRA